MHDELHAGRHWAMGGRRGWDCDEQRVSSQAGIGERMSGAVGGGRHARPLTLQLGLPDFHCSVIRHPSRTLIHHLPPP